MSEKKRSKTWFRFIDKNRVYDYKSLYNAVLWAQTKVRTSTSGEIRVFSLRRLSRGGLELQCVAFTRLNRSGSITTAWRDIDIYKEYKEKELVRTDSSSSEGRDGQRYGQVPGDNIASKTG